MRPGHGVGHEIRIERVDAADDSHVEGRPRGLGGIDESVDNVERGHGRIFGGDVSVRRALAAHGSERDDEIAHLDLRLRGSAGADTEKRVDPELAELLDSDRY